MKKRGKESKRGCVEVVRPAGGIETWEGGSFVGAGENRSRERGASSD